MRGKLNLRSRIYLLLAGLLGVALTSGAVMIWYTVHIERLFPRMIDRSLAAFESAAALEVALVNQKGFVTYYFLDNNPQWLEQFYQQRDIFQERLIRAQRLAQDKPQLSDIQRISDSYTIYIQMKDRVIEHYKQGERSEGAVLHRSVRKIFFDIIAMCEEYKLKHLEQIRLAKAEMMQSAARLRIVTVATIMLQMMIAAGLALLLVHQILVPVSKILRDTTGDDPPGPSENVVTALGHSVNDLLKSVDQAQQDLEKSRENLQQAEKMALVGRLAAGMAHSIRNPFTSVKMRLFSLGRSLQLDDPQQEDFAVISQEIRHIDTIVQNFLEFSRPPKLVIQPISPSTVVDNARQLLAHRLDSYGVKVEVVRGGPLPAVMGDSEQLKEVLVNLMINACEEMKAGGVIVIQEKVQVDGPRPMAVLRIADNGRGVPPALASKIFQPFFTTKDEGTGLGLSIASRIITEHGGTLALDRDYKAGAAFVIHLPLKEILQ